MGQEQPCIKFQLRSPRNGHNPRFLGQQPGKRDLGRCRLLLCCEPFLNQLFHRTGYVFDRHIRIDTVLIEQKWGWVLFEVEESMIKESAMQGIDNNNLEVAIKALEKTSPD